MPSDIVLLAGPLVRASSWQPTADHLTAMGWRVQVPEVLSDNGPPPSWREWTARVLKQLVPTQDAIIVGHSSASALAVELAIKLSAAGIVVVDGDIPPRHGSAGSVRPALHDLIKHLAADDGMLPIWSRWFDHDAQRKSLVGLDLLANDPAVLAEFESGLPRMHVSWFDDVIELAPWDHISAGFIQTSPLYDHAAQEAHRRNWPCINLQGTHLDPTLRPAETAAAIVSIVNDLARNP
jgi:Alpha/beta hydrolase family